MNSIAAKILMALAAVALPALGVAGVLGKTLITTVSQVEADVTTVMSAARRITELRVMMEKERGLIARLPAELDQVKVDEYAQQIAALAKSVDEAIAGLAATDRIVAATTLKEIQAARIQITQVTGEIVTATKSFAQSAALDLVNGRFEASSGIALILLDAVTSQVDAVADAARGTLRESSAAAWRLAPIGLAAVLLAMGLGFWMVRRNVVVPLRRIGTGMGRLADNDLGLDTTGWPTSGEIGQMTRAVEHFRENAAERERLEAAAETARRVAEEERAVREAAKAEEARQARATIAALADGLGRMANGDLACQIGTPFAPSFEQLRADFNAAVDKLRQTMMAVVSSTEAIHSGTQEISSASSDLARRTEQQAANLEETAAALDEITATVRKTAESAAQAREVVATAKRDAEQSGEVVRKAVEAMGGIEKSSRQINQIIGVIDEIAFQTNLLALNAGVEAARAGDAGRGFAVVASEVRALAQRSAEAAKEIKTLIQASSGQVGQGVALVAETGKSLERILVQVTEINTVVSDIAAGAREQATGLQEVNAAINQMDQATQQNAAMVEESTAASQSLSQETDQLSCLIGQFQVGHRPQAGSLQRAA